MLPEHSDAVHELQHVNSKWTRIYELYMDITPAPPLGYLDSFELGLVLKDEVDDEDVRAIFAHGKPLKFWGCPRLLVSKIVEAFRELQKEPTCLDVTVTALFGVGVVEPSEAWPQVYTSHLPCRACTTVETVEERSIPREREDPDSDDRNETVDFAVEKFHISSKNFVKRLTVALHYELEEGVTESETEQSFIFHKVTIRLTDEICSHQGSLSGIANRSSATLLLLADFASEVFGFLDRAHVGSSLLANRGLHDLICQLKQRLPVHHTRCNFEQESTGDFSSLTIRHRQRDFPYTDVRRFKIPSTAGAENDCALIRNYLSNSHVADLLPPVHDFSFTIKMLANLAARNVSVGSMELYAGPKRLSDYRSMDAVFGGMRMSELDLTCAEHRFVELAKTTDFFRMSTVQRLRKLKLTLRKKRSQAGSQSPLWVSGIHLLRNCDYYRVNYETDRHLRSIKRMIVKICEEFERGSIADIVAHFQFESTSWKEMNYAFNRDNLLVSGVRVEGKKQWYRINSFKWDVYRFRNARTSEYLTACVGRAYHAGTILHLLKGEVYPDASFADC